jgi:hypothetical protein
MPEGRYIQKHEHASTTQPTRNQYVHQVFRTRYKVFTFILDLTRTSGVPFTINGIELNVLCIIEHLRVFLIVISCYSILQ